MNNNITKNQYCDNPEKYYKFVENMSPTEFKNLSKYCDDYEYGKLNTKGREKDGVISLGKELENLPPLLVDMIYNMFFTKEGLENFALILGVTNGGKLAGAIGRQLLPKLIGETLEETLPKLGEFAVRVGGELLTNIGIDILINSLVSTIATEAVITGTLATLPVIGEVLDAGLDVVFTIIDTLMLLGMILDLWDPFGFNQELDADMLKNVSDGFNEMFMKIITTGLNRPEGDNWPVQYYADGLVYKTKLDKSTEDELVALRLFWSMEYLLSLEFNSLGNRIIPYGEKIDITKYDTNTLYHQKISEGLDKSIYFIENSTGDGILGNNPFFKRIFREYWFVILLIIGLIIVYFFLLSKKNIRK